MTRALDSTTAIGAAKEELALHYLESLGLQLVARNVRYRRGELDLIMRDKDCLVFVEVRYRRSRKFGTPVETVNWTKRQHIRAAANLYLQYHPTNLSCRFDVLAITGATSIEWLQDAFRDG